MIEEDEFDRNSMSSCQSVMSRADSYVSGLSQKVGLKKKSDTKNSNELTEYMLK